MVQLWTMRVLGMLGVLVRGRNFETSRISSDHFCQHKKKFSVAVTFASIMFSEMKLSWMIFLGLWSSAGGVLARFMWSELDTHIGLLLQKSPKRRDRDQCGILQRLAESALVPHRELEPSTKGLASPSHD